MRTSWAAGVLVLVGCATEEVSIATRQPPPAGATMCQDSSSCDVTEVCSKTSCGGPGFCEARPTTCTDMLAPVCGCDGVTYFNDCIRAASGAAKQRDGECGRDSKRCGGPMGSCDEGQNCGRLFPPGPACRDGRSEGVCWVLPSRCSTAGMGGMGGDLWHACGPSMPPPPCVSLCEAIRTNAPHERANNCQ